MSQERVDARAPLVRVRGVKKYFVARPGLLARLLTRQGTRIVRAVDGVDLDVYPGETLGLVGESGCGKTTLGRVLCRLHEPTAGQVLFDSEPESFYHHTQMIFQNPYSSLNPRKTVRQIISVPLKNRGVEGFQELEQETAYLLRRVGISVHRMDTYPHQFSGGQRQRIGIARALAMRPRFIVCDEPVSALDVSIQAQVINLLAELQDEFDLTFLFIAHDLSLVHYISDRVAIMYLGKIVEEGATDEVFAEPLHPYTQALVAAVPMVDIAARRERIILAGTVPSAIDLPQGCRFHTRCFARFGEICQEQEPELVAEGEGRRVACHLYG